MLGVETLNFNFLFRSLQFEEIIIIAFVVSNRFKSLKSMISFAEL